MTNQNEACIKDQAMGRIWVGFGNFHGSHSLSEIGFFYQVLSNVKLLINIANDQYKVQNNPSTLGPNEKIQCLLHESKYK